MSMSDKKVNDEHECGFCGALFKTARELYDHQMKDHDPDGIMFSGIELPK